MKSILILDCYVIGKYNEVARLKKVTYEQALEIYNRTKKNLYTIRRRIKDTILVKSEGVDAIK